MHFARRTRFDQTPSPFTAAVHAARAADAAGALDDLTESNPTRIHLIDLTSQVARLGHAGGAAYDPDPLGHPAARAAVARYHEDRGSSLDPSQITLTSGTSEGYGFLFKLLCERGDRVLVPAPSYPLFDFLAASEDIVLTPYPLVREHGFRPDLDAIVRAIDDAGAAPARAILLVHPNNPTGSFVWERDAEAIERIAADRGLALIVDEVFGDYAFEPLAPKRLRSFAGRSVALTFVLSGLSKVALLPQLKLGWIAASGPDALVKEAMARLEVLADTYLSVGTPVQRALPDLLADRHAAQEAMRARTATNLAATDEAIRSLGETAPVRRLPVDGGWYATLEVPRISTEDEWVRVLLDRARAIVHPGYFFDFADEGALVVSLLPDPSRFRAAIDRVARVITEACGG